MVFFKTLIETETGQFTQANQIYHTGYFMRFAGTIIISTIVLFSFILLN